MDRRRALAIAATTAMTLSAGALAFAANLGLLAHADGDSVGNLNAKNVAELLDTGKGTKTPPVQVTLPGDPASPAPPVDEPPSRDADPGAPAGSPQATAPAWPPAVSPSPEGPRSDRDDSRELPPSDLEPEPEPATVPAPAPTAPSTTVRPTTTHPPTTHPTTTEPEDDHDD
jgi:hypothetical protein